MLHFAAAAEPLYTSSVPVRVGGDVVGSGAPARAGGVELGRGRSPDPQHRPGRGAGGAMVAAAQSVQSGVPGESSRANHRVSLTDAAERNDR